MPAIVTSLYPLSPAPAMTTITQKQCEPKRIGAGAAVGGFYKANQMHTIKLVSPQHKTVKVA